MQNTQFETMTNEDAAYSRALLAEVGQNVRVKKGSGSVKHTLIITPLPAVHAYEHPQGLAISQAMEKAGYTAGEAGLTDYDANGKLMLPTHGSNPYQLYFTRKPGSVAIPEDFNADDHAHKGFIPHDRTPAPPNVRKENLRDYRMQRRNMCNSRRLRNGTGGIQH